ncbi:hypothetical protein FHS18_004526 [Paenibacillus phyllosphaerae]|uniref:SLH domain-containing protein n=1 Tax=Paenibacillus phyllosphaerae TaxID=274593 RepID=A0A7W5B0Y1_9BACL|nr:S-layer homology domain-containing protein [Paenibacillus phyllosphaerae]MBB3112425.1 hypothetical protein [Paenibacillus phyllosphaerae]
MFNKLTRLLLVLCLAAALPFPSLIAAASGDQVSNVTANYSSAGNVTVSGSSEGEQVVIQIWDANKSLVAFDSASVEAGKFSKSVNTGVLTAGRSYDVKVSDAEGGAYANEEFTVPSSSGNIGGGLITLPDTDTDTGTEPTPGTNGTLVVQAEAGSEGRATAVISSEQVSKLAEAVQGSSRTAAIQLQLPSGANSIAVTLPKAAFQQLAAGGLTVTSGIGSITLDAQSMNAIAAAEGTDIILTIGKADTSGLNAGAPAVIGSRPAVDITITAGSSEITSFGKGRVTISIPYTLGASEDRSAIVVYYIGENGRHQIVTQASLNAAGNAVNAVTTHLSTYAVGYNPVSFSDTAGHWSEDSIAYLAARSVIAGNGTSQFSPNAGVTRAEFAKMLAGIAGADVSGYRSSSFTDVKTGDWYLPYVEWAKANAIVDGIGDGRFAPTSPITREQLSTMLLKFAKHTGYELPMSGQQAPFADQAKISSWSTEAVTALQASGLLTGKPGNIFDPQGGATRAEAAKVLASLVEQMVK